MKHVIAAVFIIAMSFPMYSFALSPVTIVKGQPASLKMEVYGFGVHYIYLTLPARPPSYIPSPVKVTLSRGAYPDIFEVELAYKELLDGRISFRVDIPREEAVSYQIRVVEMTGGSLWYELFSGKLSEIPGVSH
ncbi:MULTISPECIES: hypothetical protein [unclassified Massilia]|uniref:hypothetical protein n=1 Tax=unclassified Massilia TaxID=2609279 RepID=UPI00177C416F|nr:MULTISPECIES: hypothetical protein [unclassified Massilia]MBD8530687.1 hypothetical protein [Massilia sp. CFBP 13647]MBD8674912.1 hypothetical protein [Massilia sp. CFBP 13721]